MDQLRAKIHMKQKALAGNVNTLAVGLYEELTIEH